MEEINYQFHIKQALQLLIYWKQKTILNNIISDSSQGARFLTLDLKGHFLASPMVTPSYIQIPQQKLLADISIR